MAKSNQKTKKVVDEAPPEPGPQNPEEMLSKRQQIVAKARANRKAIQDEVNIDDESLAVLNEANNTLIGGRRSASEEDPPEDREEDRKEAHDATGDKGVADSMVDVVIYGRTLKVPQSDVDRAGGIEAYQKSRAASIRMSEAVATLQRAQRREAEIDRREAKIREEEKRLAERTSSPTGSNDPEPPTQGAHEDRNDHKAKVKAIVDRIFSGNEEEAAGAIEDILSSAHGQQASPEAVAKMVVEQLRAEQGQQQPGQQQSQPAVDEYQEQQRREVNQIMASDYKDVMEDSLRRHVAKARFNELRKEPANYGRSLADMARQAAEEARRIKTEDPETERLVRQEQKRQMPAESSARSRVAPEGRSETPPPASDHILRLRKAAGLSVN